MHIENIFSSVLNEAAIKNDLAKKRNTIKKKKKKKSKSVKKAQMTKHSAIPSVVLGDKRGLAMRKTVGGAGLATMALAASQRKHLDFLYTLSSYIKKSDIPLSLSFSQNWQHSTRTAFCVIFIIFLSK